MQDLYNKISFGARLRYLRSLSPFKTQEILESLGVGRSTLYDWESDKYLPKLDKLIQLCRIYRKNLGQYLPEESKHLVEILNYELGEKENLEGELLGLGKLEPIRSSNLSPSGRLPLLLEGDLVKVPILNQNATASFVESYPADLGNYSGDTFPVFGITEEEAIKNRYVVIVVRGESMEPQIEDGAKVLCTYIPPDMYRYARGVHAVSLRSGIFTIKRISKIEGNLMTLIADNERKPESLQVEIAEVQILWKVLSVVSHRPIS